jgi:uncharacterized protein YceK
MKQIFFALLPIVVFLSGCSMFSALTSPPPNLVTAAVIEQALKDKPEWAQAAREVARTVLDQAGPSSSLTELELLAYAHLDTLELPPAQRELARAMVAGVRKGLEADLAGLGLVTAAERAVRVMEFVSWVARG